MSAQSANVRLVQGSRTIVPNLITVASGKGGVGKTWFSATLAHALSFEGAKVLLFDGDLGLANIDVQLGLTPDRDLGSVIAGRAELEEAVSPFQGGAIAQPSEGEKSERQVGFDVLAGRSGSGSLGTLSRQELQRLTTGLSKIATNYDWVIIDLAAGIDTAAKTLSTPSGKIFVVLTDEPTSLTDAYAFIKVMVMRDPQMVIEVVVNMAEDKLEGKRTYETLTRVCKNFLNFEPTLAGIIRRDQKVKLSIRQQTSILNRYPQTQAAKDAVQIAQNLQKN